MKKYIAIVGIFVYFVVFTSVANANNNDIAISEILFDPIGTDTGIEYIIIKNFGSSDIAMTGWDMYPDGIGYFTFPNFTLGAGKTVKVWLRANGTNDDANLYHIAATGNMGNSSGSAALFSSTAHSKDTIVSFVRYQKQGSTERKTWESTAASAGLWTAGTFVDISNATEGQKISLIDFSQKTSAQSWALESTENIPPPTEQNTNPDTTDAMTTSDLPGSAYFNPLPSEKMKAYAGKDITVLAGAEANFIGYAEDLKGEPLEGARFLWNFGDGAIGEGKSVLHTYRYPGVYNVYMDSSVGTYSAADMVKVTVVESPLEVSEIKPGTNGWIEIKNNSARTIDISGFGIGNANAKPFYMPPKTIVSPWAQIVFGSYVFKFPIANEGDAMLLYSNGSILSKISYKSSALAEGESLNWTGSEWVIAKSTPGEKNIIKNSISKPSSADKTKSEIVANGPDASAIKSAYTKNNSQNSAADLSDTQNNQFVASAVDSAPKMFGGYLWLVIGTGGGIFAGLLFLIAKKLIY